MKTGYVVAGVVGGVLATVWNLGVLLVGMMIGDSLRKEEMKKAVEKTRQVYMRNYLDEDLEMNKYYTKDDENDER